MYNLSEEIYQGRGDSNAELQAYLSRWLYCALAVEEILLSQLQGRAEEGMIGLHYNFIMSNFFEEEEMPLRKVRAFTLGR